MSVLKKIWQTVNRDLTGREFEVQEEHPFFGTVTFFGDVQGGYWEAELAHPDRADRFSIIIPCGRNDSLDPYAEFCAQVTSNLDALFAPCSPRLETAYRKRFQTENTTTNPTFALDHLTLPKGADGNAEWSVCYGALDTSNYFTVYFENGQVREVVVNA